MKKILSLIASLAIVATMGITPVMATTVEKPVETSKFELIDMSTVEPGTYRVTATDKNYGGFVVIEDNQGDLADFVVVSESAYGYIYIGSAFNDLSYSFNNVTFELVDTKDLGVTGKHIYSFAVLITKISISSSDFSNIDSFNSSFKRSFSLFSIFKNLYGNFTQICIFACISFLEIY